MPASKNTLRIKRQVAKEPQYLARGGSVYRGTSPVGKPAPDWRATNQTIQLPPGGYIAAGPRFVTPGQLGYRSPQQMGFYVPRVTGMTSMQGGGGSSARGMRARTAIGRELGLRYDPSSGMYYGPRGGAFSEQEVMQHLRARDPGLAARLARGVWGPFGARGGAGIPGRPAGGGAAPGAAAATAGRMDRRSPEGKERYGSWLADRRERLAASAAAERQRRAEAGGAAAMATPTGQFLSGLPGRAEAAQRGLMALVGGAGRLIGPGYNAISRSGSVGLAQQGLGRESAIPDPTPLPPPSYAQPPSTVTTPFAAAPQTQWAERPDPQSYGSFGIQPPPRPVTTYGGPGVGWGRVTPQPTPMRYNAATGEEYIPPGDPRFKITPTPNPWRGQPLPIDPYWNQLTMPGPRGPLGPLPSSRRGWGLPSLPSSSLSWDRLSGAEPGWMDVMRSAYQGEYANLSPEQRRLQSVEQTGPPGGYYQGGKLGTPGNYGGPRGWGGQGGSAMPSVNELLYYYGGGVGYNAGRP